ncbi:MAG: hypothetical protein HYZ34_04720 [Ignavibacteriae bacterium]|nr:hypothetical protein [Ignavibacteriota bacterium]
MNIEHRMSKHAMENFFTLHYSLFGIRYCFVFIKLPYDNRVAVTASGNNGTDNKNRTY